MNRQKKNKSGSLRAAKIYRNILRTQCSRILKLFFFFFFLTGQFQAHQANAWIVPSTKALACSFPHHFPCPIWGWAIMPKAINKFFFFYQEHNKWFNWNVEIQRQGIKPAKLLKQLPACNNYKTLLFSFISLKLVIIIAQPINYDKA